MQKKIIIASSKKWFFKNEIVKKFIKKNKLITLRNKKQITLKRLNKIDPDFIFFPHWSYKINQKIIKKYDCICFHTAPLPYGRGGSPIQNMILKNFKKSPVCAIKITNKIDSGPIYLKKTISLSGNLEDIFTRISLVIVQMIEIIIKKKINPKQQIGKAVIFKRIKKKQSEIKKEKNINDLFNKIRMLSAEEYPNAYIKINNFKIFFTNPIKKNNSISCSAKIFKVD